MTPSDLGPRTPKRALRACAHALEAALRVERAPLWQCVALCAAAEAACVAALTAYDTAAPEDVEGEEGRAASLMLLVRRASSSQYLDPAHQLGSGRGLASDLQRLQVLRNHVLHGHGAPLPTAALGDGWRDAARAARLCVSRLLFEAPAFDPADPELAEWLERAADALADLGPAGDV